MIDWQGLLKFSLQYSDGTHKSNFKEMSEEDKKWLEQAMVHYCNSELEQMKLLLGKLETFHQLDEQFLLCTLQNLQDLIDSLDKGSTLYKMGGHVPLLKCIFYSKYSSCRVLALQIFSAINQNDAYVQNVSINTGALELVEVVRKEQDAIVRENMIGAISAIVRGENLQAKRILIRIHGLQLLETMVMEHGTERMKNKVFTLLRDLLLYDDNLHKTFNDLSSFSNTADLSKLKQQQKKHQLTYDVNRVQAQKNVLPVNAQFKGSIRRFLQNPQRRNLFQMYLKWLQMQIKVQQ